MCAELSLIECARARAMCFRKAHAQPDCASQPRSLIITRFRNMSFSNSQKHAAKAMEPAVLYSPMRLAVFRKPIAVKITESSKVQAAKPPLVEMFTEPGSCWFCLRRKCDRDVIIRCTWLSPRLCDISVPEEQAKACCSQSTLSI